MNKRIADLFAQALDEAVPETWTTLGPVQLMRLRDKFAELIAKDIAKTVFKHLYNQDTVAEYNEYGWDCLPGDLRTMIEKHFGVE